MTMPSMPFRLAFLGYSVFLETKVAMLVSVQILASSPVRPWQPDQMGISSTTIWTAEVSDSDWAHSGPKDHMAAQQRARPSVDFFMKQD
jgi:hypothetical protein